MPEPEASPIIFDNTVLSNFALVQAFDILRQLYEGRAFICRAVLLEIQAGIDSGMIDEGYRSPLPYENGISSFINRLNE